MTVLLKHLLPLHDARERRAQRQFHEDTLAHERALLAQISAASLVVRLQGARDRAREDVLSSATSADMAMAGFQHAELLSTQATSAIVQVEQAEQFTLTALQKVRASRQAYTHRVRVNQMVKKASNEQLRQLAIARAHAEEVRNEDEYACIWTSKRLVAPKVIA